MSGERVHIGKPGDLCVEGDGRPSAEGFWCGACHMAAEKEMESYEADRIEAGISECDWFERQALEHAVVEAAMRITGGLGSYVAAWDESATASGEYGNAWRELRSAAAALQAHREARNA